MNSNRVRDHLANERTYLAWIRTAVALMGFGVVIVRLRYLLPPQLQGRTHGWELGLLFALAGLGIVGWAAFHFFHVQTAIESDTYQPAGRWIVICSLVISLIGVGVVFYLMSNPITSVITK